MRLFLNVIVVLSLFLVVACGVEEPGFQEIFLNEKEDQYAYLWLECSGEFELGMRKANNQSQDHVTHFWGKSGNTVYEMKGLGFPGGSRHLVSDLSSTVNCASYSNKMLNVYLKSKDRSSSGVLAWGQRRETVNSINLTIGINGRENHVLRLYRDHNRYDLIRLFTCDAELNAAEVERLQTAHHVCD